MRALLAVALALLLVPAAAAEGTDPAAEPQPEGAPESSGTAPAQDAEASPTCTTDPPAYADDYHGEPYLCVVGIPLELACTYGICTILKIQP